MNSPSIPVYSHSMCIKQLLLCVSGIVKEFVYLFTNRFNSPIVYHYLFFKKIFNWNCMKLKFPFSKSLVWVWVTFAVMIPGFSAFAQNGPTRYFYPDGVLSSEGTMRNGKPDGYWKAYYPNGVLKTEGNRKDFMLDSTWKFFRSDGTLEKTIDYTADLKNGAERIYDDQFVLREEYLYENNIRSGQATFYYESGKLWKTIPFVNNKEEGRGMEYAEDDERIITITTYRNGFIYGSQRINRFDNEQRKIGDWKEWYANGQLREEGYWTEGKRNGLFKFYDRKGFLERIERYVNGELVSDDDTTTTLDIRREYDEQGRVRSVGSYREGKKHGTFRHYDESGKEEGASIYELETLVAEGRLDSIGQRQGKWRLYHPEGELRAEGEYINGLREGPWTFYFRSGKIEQKGVYREDLPTGHWQWYFADGSIHRDETYRRGKEDGLATEYSDEGQVINVGEYVDGLKTGPWKLTINDHSEAGEYLDGEKHGLWVWHYDSGGKAFEGEYQAGIPVGRHRYWHANGVLKMKGSYQGGELHGVWQYFDELGMPLVETEYDQGIVTRINGKKIKSPARAQNPQ